MFVEKEKKHIHLFDEEFEIELKWSKRNKIKLPTEDEMKKEIIERRVIFNFLVKSKF